MSDLKTNSILDDVNLLKKDNWSRLGNFLFVHLITAVVVVLVCFIIVFSLVYLFKGNDTGMDGLFSGLFGLLVGAILSFGVVVAGQMYALGWYEQRRECKI